jgi:NAD(P)H dehydrogenase (quinone)
MYWGMGSGRIGMIDARDIADAAFFATVRPGHEQRIYELTGPDSISLHDVAAALGEALGRSLEYVPVPPESVEQTLQSMGMGAWFARVMRDYSAAYGEGWGDFTTDAVRRATGHEPRSIHAFAREVFAPALES